MPKMRSIAILKRICKSHRSIDYIYQIFKEKGLPQILIDNIIFNGGVCWCNQCKRFQPRRPLKYTYTSVPQLFSLKGWKKVWPWSFILKDRTRKQEVEAVNMKHCFECEKTNAFDHLFNEKLRRNTTYSNSMYNKTKRDAADSFD